MARPKEKRRPSESSPRRVMPPAPKRRKRRSSWSDLPHDLLEAVLHRLPSFRDRVCFAGVCKTWRAAERPAMPWLVTPGHCVCLHDAAIHRVVLPKKARAAACRGAFHNWLALVPMSDLPYRPFLVHAFTRARIRLPRWTEADHPITKIVLSAAPDSENFRVAALVKCGKRRKIIVCSPGKGGSWWPITEAFKLHDIVFFQGDIHAVDKRGRIHTFREGELEQQRLAPRLPRKKSTLLRRKLYLVAIPGKLLVVARFFGRSPDDSPTPYTSSCKVFAFDGREKVNRHKRIKNFAGHAIFVGDAFSGAFAVAAAGSRIEKNQVCFVEGEEGPFRQLQAYDRGTHAFYGIDKPIP